MEDKPEWQNAKWYKKFQEDWGITDENSFGLISRWIYLNIILPNKIEENKKPTPLIPKEDIDYFQRNKKSKV